MFSVSVNSKITKASHRKRLFFVLLKVAIISGGFVYSYLKLKSVEFQVFAERFSFDKNAFFLLAVFLLMPVNWFSEAIKWQILIKNIYEIGIFQALKGVLTGVATGFFTPNRVGEIFGRGIVLPKKIYKQATLLTGFGSVMQFFATVLFGIWGLSYFLHSEEKLFNVLILSVLVIVFVSGVYFFRNKILPEKVKNFLEVFRLLNNKKVLQIAGLSAFRYLVFAVQFFLLLKFFELNVSFYEGLMAIFSIYLIINLLPNVLIADLGIRTSASIFFLSRFSSDVAAISITPVLLWVINLMLPALIGGIYFLKHSKSF